MIIKHEDREYTIKELTREWKVTRELGGVVADFRIPKEGVPDVAAVESYIAEHSELFA